MTKTCTGTKPGFTLNVPKIKCRKVVLQKLGLQVGGWGLGSGDWGLGFVGLGDLNVLAQSMPLLTTSYPCLRAKFLSL